MATSVTPDRSRLNNEYLDHYARRFISGGFVTLLVIMALAVYLTPFAYMMLSSIKSTEQIAAGTVLPVSPSTFEYEGERYPLYEVPQPDGSLQQWALYDPGRRSSTFIDPNNPEAGEIPWEGRYRSLTPIEELDPQWGNFGEAWDRLNFLRLTFNTLLIAVLGVIGTVISCTLVAYGFSRFPIPFKNVLFFVLLSTIILPKQVTLVPTYAFFAQIGWTGTPLPLIIPHFFANAYNVFLLRQYFMTLPIELDEAAMIDGANPLRILWSVIIPQSYPVLVAVSLFHFVYAWNDYFEPLIYLLGAPEWQPISLGIQQFNFVFNRQPAMLQASSLMALIPPLVLFLLSQRVFMRGVVITGVDK